MRLAFVASVALALAGCELVIGSDNPRVEIFDAAPPDAGPPRLEILLEGNDPSLRVTSVPPGIVCPQGSCVLDTIAPPGMYTLTATTDVSAKFQGWRGVPGCGASATCDVRVTQATTVHARSFARARLAFVTSETFQAGLLGGRNEADAACNRLAQQADLPHVGDYVAWLAAANGAPALPSPASWVRTDGLPFALDTTKLLRGSAVRYPLRVDENGAFVAADAAVATDLDVVGGARGGSTRCGEYAGGSAGRIGAGLAGGGSRLWTENGTVGCGDAVRLYCLDAHVEAIAAATVPPLPQDDRNALVFVSNGRFTPGGGLPAADALCNQEGQVPNATFVALLAEGEKPPIARLGAADHRWRRFDNVIVFASHAALVAGKMDAAIDLVNLPNNDFVGLDADQEVWLGAPSITAPGDHSCGTWMVGDTSASGQRTTASSSTGAQTGETPCNQGKRLWCFQQ